ncbi:helix-hairpin-helix domain-containing protein [Sunxiuqinia sp. A32]|uniref:helix-hairpin-helix domain-containing protein n=1 Tax=Sunxiuqinia sp. A32 TaxID=3461496 RepID=UPI004045BB4A
MQNKIITLFAFLISFSLNLKAQQPIENWQDQILDFIESTYSGDENLDVEQLIEDLQRLAENPLNINNCSFYDLKQLSLLSPIQIQNLLSYRKNYGKILSAYELIAVDGFEPTLIKVIQPFIYFGDSQQDSIKSYSKQEIILRATQLVEKQKGFKEPKKYEGSPLKFYTRYRYSTQQINFGLTAEKDAGESFLQSSNKTGFDYFSGYASYNSRNNENQIIVGDYRLQFGQGLVAWQGFSLGKSSEVTQGAKFNQGIKPYTSTNENMYMRGITSLLTLGKFKFTPFFSIKNFDANIDSVNQQAIFTSFQTSGLHRTQSEIADKNSVQERSIGSYLTFSGHNYTIGITALNTKYNLPLDRRDAEYNQFLFEGKQLSNFSIDYQVGFNRYFHFAEFATSSTKGMAIITGILAKPIDKIETSIIYRNIGKRYNAPYAMAFTEGSKINDEEGIYIGMKLFPAPKISLVLYADYFKHRSIKYTTIAPSKGSEYLFQVNYQLNRKWETYVRYFYEIKPVKATVDGEKINLNQTRQKLRIHVSGDLSNRFFLRSRFELSRYAHDHHSKGFLLFQDIGFQSEKLNSKWWLRLSYFNTDDYDARIYTYENDLLYQFAIPAFYNEGVRSYLNGKVKICEKTEIWIKASRTWFFDVESIGSSYSQIDGNKRTELKIQLRHRF